ncbi:MAG: DUF1043 family protein [Desulfobulbaceae bacterium]|nr:DUF1043 family protein [Desulfobulbaceae bacterium]
MAETNWEMIILIIIVGLIIFAGLGIFVGTRISSDRRRIRELEDELAETKKNLETYRSKVNTHFKKTSELFGQMTDSYRAIYMHLAEGSQELCTTDAVLLKPATVEFLKVTHDENKPAAEEGVSEPAAQKPEPAAAEQGVQPREGASDISQPAEPEKPDTVEKAPAEKTETLEKPDIPEKAETAGPDTREKPDIPEMTEAEQPAVETQEIEEEPAEVERKEEKTPAAQEQKELRTNL